ncbi:MAG: septum formation initiator family protein [Arcobacteraceae bacterium]|jgi:cell division protein FtsB|nr:septum formation initiator family protein [Arcobacteraceae bacterium]
MKEIIKGFKFTPSVIISIIITVFFANYIASLLFSGKNSLDTYNDLKTKKVQLEEEIKRLQTENASLQKDYFELKNLEPEQ